MNGRVSFPWVLAAVLVIGRPESARAEDAPKSTAAPVATTTSAAPARELPELVTDRPDITESSRVVGRGIWQLESGVSFERDGGRTDGARALSAPMALVRLGLSDRLELRIGADGFVSSKSLVAGAPRTSGFSDLDLGVKYVLADQAHLGVDLAVIPFVSLPTGSRDVSSGSYDPTVKFTWARDLPRGFGLSGNVNVNSTTDGERFTNREVMLSLGHSLAGGWSGFWEAYGASALERGGAAAWLVDTGVTHPWGANAQFDISVGRGLNAAAPNWFFGIGVSMRGLIRR